MVGEFLFFFSLKLQIYKLMFFFLTNLNNKQNY